VVMVLLDVAADLFSGRDLIGIIPDQIDLLLFDRPIKPLCKRIVGRASHPGKRQIGCQGVEKLLGDCRCVGRSPIHSELGLGLTANANLNGIEYIISEQLFETLTQEERQYWHPHNGEILSGSAGSTWDSGIGRERTNEGEDEQLRKDVARMGNGPRRQASVGAADVAWSFNRDGEAKPGLVQDRDEKLGIDTKEKRRERQDW
jgi:hypothetical protein